MTTPRRDVWAEIEARLTETRADTPDLPAVRIASALALFREGLATEAEMLSWLAELGADPLQRDRLLLSAQLDRRLEVAQASRAAFVGLLRKGTISQENLEAILVRVGFIPEAAGLLVTLEALRAGQLPEDFTTIPTVRT